MPRHGRPSPLRPSQSGRRLLSLNGALRRKTKPRSTAKSHVSTSTPRSPGCCTVLPGWRRLCASQWDRTPIRQRSASFVSRTTKTCPNSTVGACVIPAFGVRAEHTWGGSKCPPAVALRDWKRARFACTNALIFGASARLKKSVSYPASACCACRVLVTVRSLVALAARAAPRPGDGPSLTSPPPPPRRGRVGLSSPNSGTDAGPPVPLDARAASIHGGCD